MTNYRRYRNQLLKTDPFCQRCGVEHGTGADALQYHHRIPQHTGHTDHSDGYLLCKRCHNLIHAIERRQHKVVDARGYTHGAFVGQRKRKAERRKHKAERLTAAWT